MHVERSEEKKLQLAAASLLSHLVSRSVSLLCVAMSVRPYVGQGKGVQTDGGVK